MNAKQKMSIALISIILLSATALAASPATQGKTTTKLHAKLHANFTATHNLKTPLNVKFTDKSIGSPTSWSWNFGDKTQIVTTKNAIHTYKKPGKYTVTLTVKNAKGQISKATKIINLKLSKK